MYSPEPPSFTKITSVILISPSITYSGSESSVIIRLKVSLSSNKLSLLIVILNDTLVTPARNVTLYGPEL